MDDWQFVPLLEKAKNGTLTFQESSAPHDEHRLFLPRISIIVSLFATGGDYRASASSRSRWWRLFRLVSCGSWCVSTEAGAACCGHGCLQTSLSSRQSSSTTGSGRCSLPNFLPYTFLALCLCALYARVPALPEVRAGGHLRSGGQLEFCSGQLDLACRSFGHFICPGYSEKGCPQKFCRRVGPSWYGGGDLLFLGPRTQLSCSGLRLRSRGSSANDEHLARAPRTPCEYSPPDGPFHTWHVRKFHRAGFPGRYNLVFTQICGAIVLTLALFGLAMAWRRGLFFNRALPWACLLLFTFLTAAFVCVGRVWRGNLNR